jgi:hypothetical protein
MVRRPCGRGATGTSTGYPGRDCTARDDDSASTWNTIQLTQVLFRNYNNSVCWISATERTGACLQYLQPVLFSVNQHPERFWRALADHAGCHVRPHATDAATNYGRHAQRVTTGGEVLLSCE